MTIIAVKKSSVDRFAADATQTALNMKARLSQKIDSAPVLKKISEKVKAFDAKMSEKYGKRYRTARNMALGMGMAYGAARFGAEGLAALGVVNTLRAVAPMCLAAEKAKEKGSCSGLTDYMARHKADAALSCVSAGMSLSVAVAGVSGNEALREANGYVSAGLATIPQTASLAKSAAKWMTGRASWKDVRDDAAVLAMTFGAYLAGSRDRQDGDASDLSARRAPLEHPSAAVDPSVRVAAPVPDTIPHADIPAAEVVPINRPVDPKPFVRPDPLPEPDPVTMPDLGRPVAPDVPSVTIPDIKPEPVPTPENDYEGAASVFVQESFVTGERTVAHSFTRDIDGAQTDRFEHQTKTLNGGLYTRTQDGEVYTSFYTAPDGTKIELHHLEDSVNQSLDKNADGVISPLELQNTEKSFHAALTQNYGKEVADQIIEARAYEEEEVKVQTSTKSINRAGLEYDRPQTPQDKALAGLERLKDALRAKGR